MSAQDEFDPPAKLSAEDEVAALVSVYREDRGFSQSELARRMSEKGHKWTQSTVYKVEQEGRKLTFTEGMALVDIFGIRPTALLDLRPERRLLEGYILALVGYTEALRGSAKAVRQAEEFLQEKSEILYENERVDLANAIARLRNAMRDDSEA